MSHPDRITAVNDLCDTDVNPRQVRGQRIADRFRISQRGPIWLVPSESNERTRYHVDPFAASCNCPDFESRGLKCKHQWAVEYTVTRETSEAGTETVTQSLRVTYSQDWPTYNAAQTHEHERFLPLLRELCDGIEQPVQTFGRPRLPLSDVVFALGVKSYSTLSGRRATSYVREAEGQGFMDVAPSYNSAFRYLESDDLTAVLKTLIEESARPLASIESDFAIDSTGFGTTTYRRWFDHKWGRERSTQTWVKTHIVTGVTTNIVTAAKATASESADAPQLPELIGKTAETFTMREVSADKGYISRRNLHAIKNLGAEP